MKKKLLWVAGGGAWFALCLVFSFWLTFPSTALIDRARYEVQTLTDGSVALNMAGLSPGWMGATGYDVEFVSVGEDGEGTTLLRADAVHASAGLFGLLLGEPSFSGWASFGGGTLEYGGFVGANELGEVGLREIRLRADDFPMSAFGALAAPFIGDGYRGRGTVNMSVDLEIPEGLRSANGKITLAGKKLTFSINIPDPLGGDEPYPLGPVAVTDLDIVLNVQNGKATVSRGRLQSDLVTLALDGRITLNDRPGKSRLGLEAVLSELGGDLAVFESFFNRAKWDDGKYHYSISCAFDRIDSRCFKAKRKKSKRKRANKRKAEDMTPEELEERDRNADERRKKREERRAQRKKNGDSPARNGRNPRRPGSDQDGPNGPNDRMDRDDRINRDDADDRGPNDDFDEGTFDDERDLQRNDDLPAPNDDGQLDAVPLDGPLGDGTIEPDFIE